MPTRKEVDSYYHFIQSLEPEGKLRACVRELAGLALLDGIDLKDFTLPEDGYEILERWSNLPASVVHQHDDAIQEEVAIVHSIFSFDN